MSSGFPVEWRLAWHVRPVVVVVSPFLISPTPPCFLYTWNRTVADKGKCAANGETLQTRKWFKTKNTLQKRKMLTSQKWRRSKNNPEKQLQQRNAANANHTTEGHQATRGSRNEGSHNTCIFCCTNVTLWSAIVVLVGGVCACRLRERQVTVSLSGSERTGFTSLCLPSSSFPRWSENQTQVSKTFLPFLSDDAALQHWVESQPCCPPLGLTAISPRP